MICRESMYQVAVEKPTLGTVIKINERKLDLEVLYSYYTNLFPREVGRGMNLDVAVISNERCYVNYPITGSQIYRRTNKEIDSREI